MTDEPESFDELSAAAQNKAAEQASSAVSAVAKHAQKAIDSAKDFVAGAKLDDVGARAAETASNLYRGGRELLAGNDGSVQGGRQSSAAVRKNPLAAVGVAFTAGLLPRAPHSRLGGHAKGQWLTARRRPRLSDDTQFASRSANCAMALADTASGSCAVTILLF